MKTVLESRQHSVIIFIELRHQPKTTRMKLLYVTPMSSDISSAGLLCLLLGSVLLKVFFSFYFRVDLVGRKYFYLMTFHITMT